LKKILTVLNCNNGYLECYGCGSWFDYNGKILPASLGFASRVMDAFNQTHVHYEQTAKGKRLEQAADELHRHVTELIAANGWTQDDIDAGKGQAILPGKIREFMRENGAWD